jgi:uncharacterized protein (TIGR02246 family)
MNDEKDRQQIRELIETWMRASAEGDIERVLTLMAEDVVFLLPGRPPMCGRKAFAEATRGATSGARLEGQPDIREIHISGNYAYCWNHLSLTATPLKGGTPLHRAGDILSVFKKEPDGRWVLFRDANLLSAAAPSATK